MSLRSIAFAFLLSGLAASTTVSAQDVAAVDGSVEGEVGSATSELQGRPNAANGAACGCSTAGARSTVSPIAFLGGAVLLGGLALRRRRA